MRILVPVLLLGLAFEASAEDLVIDMTSDDAFSTRVAHVDVGQTITWLPISKGHNVEFAKGPDGLKLPSKSKLSEEFSVKFTDTGVYLYWCKPHKETGMLGLIVVGNDLSNLSEIAMVKISRQSDFVLQALVASLN